MQNNIFKTTECDSHVKTLKYENPSPSDRMTSHATPNETQFRNKFSADIDFKFYKSVPFQTFLHEFVFH